MTKQQTKTTAKRSVRFEPGRVLVMTAVVSVLTLVFIGALATL